VAANLPEEPDWAFDLLSSVPHRRMAALTRHRELLRDASVALARMNAIWAEAGTPVPDQPHLVAARDQAQAAFDAARNGTIFGPIGGFVQGTHRANHHQHDRYAPFAVLFLQWERRHPKEWSEASTWTWSHWGTKELVLRRFAEAGIPAGVYSDAIGLVSAAVAGPYRCKDWRYAPLARLLDGPKLRAGIEHFLNHAELLPRQRAQFLLYMLDHPEIAIRRHTWRQWVIEQHDRRREY
jgi:hypothetical protein